VFDESGETPKAIGIEYLHKGAFKKVSVNKEIVLSAGAIGSPQILQLSGVASTDLLNKHLIPVVKDLKVLKRTGALTLAASQIVIFTKTRPDVDRPDIQFHFQPLSADKPGEGVHPFSAFTTSVCQLRPHSRGHIEIKSTDPLQHPAIHPNYLSDERDLQVAVDSIKVARKLAEAPALANEIYDELQQR